jgi:hypothetical protein
MRARKTADRSMLRKERQSTRRDNSGGNVDYAKETKKITRVEGVRWKQITKAQSHDKEEKRGEVKAIKKVH